MRKFENLRMLFSPLLEKVARHEPRRVSTASERSVYPPEGIATPQKKRLAMTGVFLMFVLSLSSCKVYSLREGSIPPDIKSVTIGQFTNQSTNGSTAISQKLTNALKDRFVQQTNLRQVDQGGDIEFKGAIIGYQIAGNAPTAAQTTALNRLTVTIKVDFTNNRHEKESWSSTFSRFAEYESGKQLVQVEDALLTDIDNQLVDDIYNKALVNW